LLDSLSDVYNLIILPYLSDSLHALHNAVFSPADYFTEFVVVFAYTSPHARS